MKGRNKPDAREVQKALDTFRSGMVCLFVFNIVMVLAGVAALVFIALYDKK